MVFRFLNARMCWFYKRSLASQGQNGSVNLWWHQLHFNSQISSSTLLPHSSPLNSKKQVFWQHTRIENPPSGYTDRKYIYSYKTRQKEGVENFLTLKNLPIRWFFSSSFTWKYLIIELFYPKRVYGSEVRQEWASKECKKKKTCPKIPRRHNSLSASCSYNYSIFLGQSALLWAENWPMKMWDTGHKLCPHERMLEIGGEGEEADSGYQDGISWSAQNWKSKRRP